MASSSFSFAHFSLSHFVVVLLIAVFSPFATCSTQNSVNTLRVTPCTCIYVRPSFPQWISVIYDNTSGRRLAFVLLDHIALAVVARLHPCVERTGTNGSISDIGHSKRCTLSDTHTHMRSFICSTLHVQTETKKKEERKKKKTKKTRVTREEFLTLHLGVVVDAREE